MVIFIFSQLLIVFPAVERDVLDFVELLPVGPVTPLHTSVDLGPAGRVHEQHDLGSPAGLFELVHELRAAIDLDGPDPKRKLHPQMVKEVGRGRAGLPFVGLRPHELDDLIPGAELEPLLSRDQAHSQGVDLDQIAGGLHPVSLGYFRGIARLTPAFPGQFGLSDVDRFHQQASSFELVHFPPDRAPGDHYPFPFEQYSQLVPAPAGSLIPQLQDPVFDGQGRLGLPDMPGSARFILKGGQIIGVVAILPPVEGLRGNAEVSAGQPGILMPGIMIHPAQPLGCRRGDRPLADQRPNVLRAWDERSVGGRRL